MTVDQSAVGATFVIYLILTMLIGAFAYQQTNNYSDYVLGGRRLGPWATAFSAGASDMSGWLLLGLPGFAYVAGLEAVWIGLGLFIGTYLNWHVVAARLRTYSVRAGDSLTLPEYFEKRFGDNSNVLRVSSAFFILLFFLLYTSSGLVAGGKLFNSVFDLPYHWAVSVGAIAIIIYTFVGGFLAVSWTDVVQGLLMLLALLFVPVIAVSDIGGWDNTVAKVSQRNPELLTLFSDNQGKPLTWVAIVSLLGWGLGYFGQPHILARFKAIRSVQDLPGAGRIAVSWVLLCLIGAFFVGFVGIGFLESPLHGTDTETVFIVLVRALFHPVIAGICLAAILAAIMSTADSQLLVSASVFTGDLYPTLFRKHAGQQELMWVGRAGVLAIALAALVLAWDPERKVLDLVSYAWAGFGASFGPTVLLSLYWRRMNRYGALAGIVVGAVTVILWKQLDGGLFDLYEIVPGFILSAISIIVVSYCTMPPSEEIVFQFESLELER